MAGRRRRTAEEARAAILEATEARLVAGGPKSIRLTDVARDVGVSHPTVLHHFGSREDLIDAVVTRAFDALYADIVAAIADGVGDDAHIPSIIERVFEALRSTGHGRVMAWLVLDDVALPERRLDLAAVIDAAHAARILHCERSGLPVPARRDTAYAVLLATFSLFGQALAGDQVLLNAGLPDAGPDFRAWFAELVRFRLGDAAC